MSPEKKKRLKKIIHFLNQKDEVTVKEIARSLNVSEMTIRRDLNDLENEKIIKRTHGGAVLYSSSPCIGEWSFYAKKQSIGSAV